MEHGPAGLPNGRFHVQRALRSSGKGEWKRLIESSAAFCEKTGKPELAHEPLAFCGHSGGGQFAYHFACRKPEKVIGFVAIKGGFYETAPTQVVRLIPRLWMAGEKDEVYRRYNISMLMIQGRRGGALWAMAVEPRSGHEVGQSFSLARIFLDDVFQLRLSPSADLGIFFDIKIKQGWWGFAP